VHPSSNTEAQTVIKAELGNKVQFVYEIAFARRELKGLGYDIEPTLGDTIKFEISPPYDIDFLAKRLAHFAKVGGTKTEYSWIISKNQSRSDNQYLTHWYYPYKGKYHPRLIRSLFNILSLRDGMTILDPFVGSGTTCLEAHLYGIHSIGIDISPVCQIVSKVKATAGEVALQVSALKKYALDAIRQDYKTYMSRPIDQKKMFKFKNGSYDKFLSSIRDQRVRNFYILARLIFASDLGRRNRDLASFEKNLQKMLLSAADLSEVEGQLKGRIRLGNVTIKQADARNMKSIKSNSIDAIITSPPYSIALNYIYNDRHALAQLNTDVNELSNNCIGVSGKGKLKLKLYKEAMQRCYEEMYRVLKEGCQCVIVLGEATVDGEFTSNVENTKNDCKNIGFSLVDDLPKKIFGLYNTINDEKVLFFEK
jgi:DNA modification methylase